MDYLKPPPNPLMPLNYDILSQIQSRNQSHNPNKSEQLNSEKRSNRELIRNMSGIPIFEQEYEIPFYSQKEESSRNAYLSSGKQSYQQKKSQNLEGLDYLHDPRIYDELTSSKIHDQIFDFEQIIHHRNSGMRISQTQRQLIGGEAVQFEQSTDNRGKSEQVNDQESFLTETTPLINGLSPMLPNPNLTSQNSLQDNVSLQRCGAIVPLSMTQRELSFDAHGKISMIEKLIGRVKEAKAMRRHYIQMLLSQNMLPLNETKVQQVLQTAKKDKEHAITILDKTKVQPDPQVTKMAKVNPVHAIQLCPVENIVSNKLQEPSNLRSLLKRHHSRDEMLSMGNICRDQSRLDSYTQLLSSSRSKLQLSSTQINLPLQSRSISPVLNSSYDFQKDTNRVEVPSASCLSKYLPQPLIDVIQQKCKQRLQDYSLGGNVNKIVQAQKHTRILANLSKGALQSYNDEEISSRMKMIDMNKRIRSQNAAHTHLPVRRKSQEDNQEPIALQENAYLDQTSTRKVLQTKSEKQFPSQQISESQISFEQQRHEGSFQGIEGKSLYIASKDPNQALSKKRNSVGFRRNRPITKIKTMPSASHNHRQNDYEDYEDDNTSYNSPMKPKPSSNGNQFFASQSPNKLMRDGSNHSGHSLYRQTSDNGGVGFSLPLQQTPLHNIPQKQETTTSPMPIDIAYQSQNPQVQTGLQVNLPFVIAQMEASGKQTLNMSSFHTLRDNAPDFNQKNSKQQMPNQQQGFANHCQSHNLLPSQCNDMRIMINTQSHEDLKTQSQQVMPLNLKRRIVQQDFIDNQVKGCLSHSMLIKGKLGQHIKSASKILKNQDISLLGKSHNSRTMISQLKTTFGRDSSTSYISVAHGPTVLPFLERLKSEDRKYSFGKKVSLVSKGTGTDLERDYNSSVHLSHAAPYQHSSTAFGSQPDTNNRNHAKTQLDVIIPSSVSDLQPQVVLIPKKSLIMDSYRSILGMKQRTIPLVQLSKRTESQNSKSFLLTGSNLYRI